MSTEIAASGDMASEIASVLKEVFAAEKVMVQDESNNCGDKFAVYCVSSKFEGIKVLDRHRMVNEALKDQIAQIHAITINAWTPAQFETKKDKLPAELL